MNQPQPPVDEFEAYRDEFGFVAPLPLADSQRKIPDEGFPTGPEVGTRLPDFELPSADGTMVRLHEDREDSRAAVTFFRSAVW